MIKALLSAQTLDRCEKSFAYSEDGAVVSVSILSSNGVHPERRLSLIEVKQKNECNKRGLKHKISRYYFVLVR